MPTILPMARLSKSKLMAGAQCAKRMWLAIHRPALAEDDPSAQRRFDIGHEVGQVARTLWPDGLLIGYDDDMSRAINETRQRLTVPGPVTLFEATFSFDGVLVRADVLERSDAGEIRLVEVKSSTSAKPEHATDCAIQYWVLDRLGMAPNAVELAYIDNRFVYPGDRNYRELFSFMDLTDDVRGLQPQVARHIGQMKLVASEGMPDIEPGMHCHKPYSCPFFGYCLPKTTEYPVTSLGGRKEVHYQLREQGIDDVREIPAGRLTDARQEWIRRVTKAGEPELDPAAAGVINALGWPRHYLDFETVSFGVPVWKGTGPYKAYPFQWSCHIEHATGAVSHREYLANSGDEPPMHECMESLIEALDDGGPVLVYTNYEKRVLNDMARLYPDLRRPLEGIIARLFDLYPVVRAYYYHPDMHGQWSIKRVLPTIAPELAYEDLELISEGTGADAAFAKIAQGRLRPAEQVATLDALRKYCRRDTEAMRLLANRLAGRDVRL